MVWVGCLKTAFLNIKSDRMKQSKPYLSSEARMAMEILQEAREVCRQMSLDESAYLVPIAQMIQHIDRDAVFARAFVADNEPHPTALEAMAMALRDIANRV